MRRGVVAIGMGLLALTACGGGSDADPIDTASTTTVTTLVETSSTTSTSPSTSTTTEPPATTIDPTEALIAEIEADLNEGEQALLSAIAAPEDPASEEMVRPYFAGDSLDLVLTGLEELRNEGLVGRPNEDVPSVIVVRDAEEVNIAESRAVILVCRVDAAVIIDVSPDGGEAIVNDRITTVVSRTVVVRQEGLWVFETGERIENLDGATTCS